MRGISLFSGAGGLDLASEAAGFMTVAAVENNETAVGTLLANRERFFPCLRPDTVMRDIVELAPEELLERAGLEPGEAARAWWAALHPVLEERVLARVQTGW